MNDVEANYNGWSNTETWLASLWLASDEAAYAIIQEARLSFGDTYERKAWLEDEINLRLMQLNLGSCLWRDLLQLSLDRIDWQEIIAKS